jgi:hypothetical protein
MTELEALISATDSALDEFFDAAKQIEANPAALFYYGPDAIKAAQRALFGLRRRVELLEKGGADGA